MDMELSDLLKELMPEDMGVEEIIKQCLAGTNLFGTIIIDTYTHEETDDIYNALDIVCNRKGFFSFDHYGIYTFWDFDTKEILYIGLSKNIRNRFANHNGISGTSEKGNKYKYITEYFNNNERLGYTILVQSPFEHKDEFLDSKDDEIKQIEGALLEDFKNNFGRLPIWNDIGGSIYGRTPYMINRYGNIFDMIVGKTLDFMNAKSTLRELAKDLDKLAFESDLNVIRGRMYKYGESFEEAMEKLIKFNDYFISIGMLATKESNQRFEKLIESSYINKGLKVPGY